MKDGEQDGERKKFKKLLKLKSLQGKVKKLKETKRYWVLRMLKRKKLVDIVRDK